MHNSAHKTTNTMQIVQWQNHIQYIHIHSAIAEGLGVYMCLQLYHGNQKDSVSPQILQMSFSGQAEDLNKTRCWMCKTRTPSTACLSPYPKSLLHRWASCGMLRLQCTTVWVRGHSPHQISWGYKHDVLNETVLLKKCFHSFFWFS